MPGPGQVGRAQAQIIGLAVADQVDRAVRDVPLGEAGVVEHPGPTVLAVPRLAERERERRRTREQAWYERQPATSDGGAEGRVLAAELQRHLEGLPEKLREVREVREDIVMTLREAEQQVKLKEYIDQLKKESYIKILKNYE